MFTKLAKFFIRMKSNMIIGHCDDSGSGSNGHCDDSRPSSCGHCS